MDFSNILEKAIAIAKQAGDIPRQYMSKPRLHDLKSTAIDLVTEADRETEAFIQDTLRREFPEFGIIGEEGSDYVPASGSSTHYWLVDPIDGTTNFAHRLPHFAVIIGLMDSEQQPVLGVVYDPMRDEVFSAYRGGGAFLNGQPIRVSETPDLNQALLSTGFPYDRRIDPDNNLSEWNVFKLKVQGGRRLGSAGLDLAYVAAGRLDGYWEMKLNPWDCQVGILLTEEAGGKVTDYMGGREGLAERRVNLVASNGRIHDEMLVVLWSVRGKPR